MERARIVEKIEQALPDIELTIGRAARFKKKTARSVWFYTLVALNRFTPLLIPIRARTLWGHTFTAYETSAIGSIFFLGFYDSDVSLFLLKHYREEGDILDVGANIGLYTSLFTQIAPSTARITAFEPTPSTYTLLTQNVGKMPQVATENIALSDHSGVADFYDYGYRNGVYNSINVRSYSFLQNTGEKISVPTETLDGWCTRTGAKPSLIKMDTEGTEADILQHAHHVLTTYHPLILLEVGGGEAWSANNTASMDILIGHGYSFFSLLNDGTLTPHARKSTYTYENLVAIHTTNLSSYV